MAGNSPTSPLPGVTRGGAKAAPIGSLGSITIHSPLGSVTNGGAFASGHFKVTPHGQRRRWADMTPVEMWPATPSPGAGPEALHSFGVPAASATPTSPSTVPAQAFPAYTVTSQPQGQPQHAPPSHMQVHPAPAPVQAVPAAASIPAPFSGGVIPAGMPAVPMPGMPMPMPVQGGADGTQMVIMQVPAGSQQPQAFIQMPMAPQQPGAQLPKAAQSIGAKTAMMQRRSRPGHLRSLGALCAAACVVGFLSETFVSAPRRPAARSAARAATEDPVETPASPKTQTATPEAAPQPGAVRPGASVAGFQEVKSGEGFKKARQFLALEPLDDEVNQWEADMKSTRGLTAEEERKKWVAIISGAVTFLLGGAYVLLNVAMDSTDWSGFAGERTLSPSDLAVLGK
ncbi:hypothetical protein AK812_SmicGene16419 [Symbiodinium microadriaticum]|uniref:Uncharacterized protein n=1 Tax=Symbiodinium microadriaticum TaxID=2951 RepID=A0A1Q9E0C9_SYMMI|nr:hypothetical protein AK812_SmicGene16419 [Symbiodinium microadriaticum]CAE7845113.1 unnamed protein product [Symbiodinium microadriaticum]CAE7940330.1 unnamed protein product [Symbiodinium sp. KB8]